MAEHTFTRTEPARLDDTVEALATLFDVDLHAEYGRTTLVLAQRLLDGICTHMDEHPGSVSAVLAHPDSADVARIEHALGTQVRALLGDRVPAIGDEEAAVTAAVVITVTLSLCGAYDRADRAQRANLRHEMPYMLCAYLYAKFPPPNDFTWSLPTRGIRPSLPSRRDFTESVVLIPAGSNNR